MAWTKESRQQWRRDNLDRVREQGRRGSRIYRENHLDECKARNRAYSLKNARANRDMCQALKELNGCIDCGTQDGELEFDHRDINTKAFTIGDRCGGSPGPILDEIRKCDVRCKSCHMKRHGKKVKVS